MQQELEVLRHENETVHISMFENKVEFNKQIDMYKNEITELEKARQKKEIEFQNIIKSKKDIENEMGSIKEEKLQLKMQYALFTSKSNFIGFSQRLMIS